MTTEFELQPQGDHEYLIRLRDAAGAAESWCLVSPGVLGELGAADEDEEEVVRYTVEFLTRHQGVADFPAVVELEDVIASYAGYPKAVRQRGSAGGGRAHEAPEQTAP